MSYTRELPRDLFNEAKLLKCLGQITLLNHNNVIRLRIEHHTYIHPGFIIEQDSSDGSISVLNIQFITPDGKTAVEFFTALNSKDPYPLYFIAGDQEHAALDDQGNPTPELLDLCGFTG